jgi:hypothetical protein
MQKLLQAERSTAFPFVVSGIDLEQSGPRLRSGTVNSDESKASAPLGRRAHPPSEVEVLISCEYPGPRAQPRGPSHLRPRPHPQPLSRGEGSRAGVADCGTPAINEKRCLSRT